MFELKKMTRRALRMVVAGTCLSLLLLAVVLLTGGTSPHEEQEREFLELIPERHKLRKPQQDVAPEPTIQPISSQPLAQDLQHKVSKPKKETSGPLKKYNSKPPLDGTPNLPGKDVSPHDDGNSSTAPNKPRPIPPPNPQVYVLPSEDVKLVFPDDDENEMAAGLRALDKELGRSSDLHAIILESGEDTDAFSRALRDFQERTYTLRKEHEEQPHSPTPYQEHQPDPSQQHFNLHYRPQIYQHTPQEQVVQQPQQTISQLPQQLSQYPLNVQHQRHKQHQHQHKHQHQKREQPALPAAEQWQIDNRGVLTRRS